MTRIDLESAAPAAARLKTSLGLAAAGAVLLVVGPVTGVVSGATPAFTSWPLLAVLAFLPVLVAGAFLVNGRPGLAAGVLATTAAFGPGRILIDLQIAVDALAVSRPELLRPDSLAPLSPAAGLWLLLAGHVLIIAAGVLAAGVPTEDAEASNKLILVIFVSLLAVIGLTAAPFRSTDPFLLARGPLDATLFGLIGWALLAAAVLLGAAFAVSSSDPAIRRGGLIGVAIGIASVAVPPVVAGVSVDGLGVSWGPLFALAAAALLLLVRGERAEHGDVELPGESRLHTAAGIIGVLAGLAVLGGAVAPQLVIQGGLTPPVNYADRLLWPAGIAVWLIALGLLARGTAAAVRPAFLVSLAALPLAVAAALDAVLAATQIGAVQAGWGVWLLVGGVLLASVAACCGALAGGMERDDLERAKQEPAPLTVLVPVFLAGLLAVGAFAMPALRAPDFKAPGIFTSFHVASWGLAAGLLAVLVAVALSVASRPPRAAALLLGAAVVVGTRLLELPLTGARAPGAVVGPGTWLAAACLLALLVAAAMSASRR